MVCMGENMVKCDICGKDVDELDARSLNIGKSIKIMCPKCYKQGNKEVTWYQLNRWSKINKQENRRSE